MQQELTAQLESLINKYELEDKIRRNDIYHVLVEGQLYPAKLIAGKMRLYTEGTRRRVVTINNITVIPSSSMEVLDLYLNQGLKIEEVSTKLNEKRGRPIC